MRSLIGSARSLDERLLRRAADAGTSPDLHLAMRIASRLGDGPIWIGAGLAALVAAGPAGLRLVAQGTLAALLNALIYRACKSRFVRLRPFRALADLPALWSPPEDFSFPSGHALHAFASATVIAVNLPALAVPALLLAAVIGVSRVVLAVHYPSDVLAGALAGTLVAIAITAAV